jgi:hypothetical protein
MRTPTLGLLLALLAAPAVAQEHRPIIDVHLHAVRADHLGPPPVAMCTPMPYPAWDPSRPYGELFGELARTPPCPDPRVVAHDRRGADERDDRGDGAPEHRGGVER